MTPILQRGDQVLFDLGDERGAIYDPDTDLMSPAANLLSLINLGYWRPVDPESIDYGAMVALGRQVREVSRDRLGQFASSTKAEVDAEAQDDLNMAALNLERVCMAGMNPGGKELALASGLDEKTADRVSQIGAGWSSDPAGVDGLALMVAASQAGASGSSDWDAFRAERYDTFVTNSVYRTAEEWDVKVRDAEQALAISQAQVHAMFPDLEAYVKLYRGVDGARALTLEAGPASIDQFPVSSWTTTKDIAAQFSRLEGGYAKEDGFIITRTLQVKDIAGFAASGLGNGSHREVTVLGRGPVDVEIERAIDYPFPKSERWDNDWIAGRKQR